MEQYGALQVLPARRAEPRPFDASMFHRTHFSLAGKQFRTKCGGQISGTIANVLQAAFEKLLRAGVDARDRRQIASGEKHYEHHVEYIAVKRGAIFCFRRALPASNFRAGPGQGTKRRFSYFEGCTL